MASFENRLLVLLLELVVSNDWVEGAIEGADCVWVACKLLVFSSESRTRMIGVYLRSLLHSRAGGVLYLSWRGLLLDRRCHGSS